MSKQEITKRYALFVFSLFLSALGVALTRQGEMGVSPISSVANVLSFRFTDISLGMWLIAWNCLLIFGQILILRKKFQLVQLIQIPLSFLFGYFTDLGLWMTSFLPDDIYFFRLIMVLAGIVILSLGVALSVIANVVMNSGEAFVQALTLLLKKKFGNVKIAFDIICVVFSIALSLFLLDGNIIGTGEGTILTALFTGFIVNFFVSRLSNPCKAFLCLSA